MLKAGMVACRQSATAMTPNATTAMNTHPAIFASCIII
jgi:hypothetical protein